MSTYNNTSIGFNNYRNTYITINGIELLINSGHYSFGMPILQKRVNRQVTFPEIIPLGFSIEKRHTKTEYRYQVYLDRSTGELLCDIIHDPKITPVEEHLIAIHQFLKMRKLAK